MVDVLEDHGRRAVADDPGRQRRELDAELAARADPRADRDRGAQVVLLGLGDDVAQLVERREHVVDAPPEELVAGYVQDLARTPVRVANLSRRGCDQERRRLGVEDLGAGLRGERVLVGACVDGYGLGLHPIPIVR